MTGTIEMVLKLTTVKKNRHHLFSLAAFCRCRIAHNRQTRVTPPWNVDGAMRRQSGSFRPFAHGEPAL
jgi:hypothetical protein